MKNIVKLFALAALCAGLFSCQDKPTYNEVPFVSMYRTSATIEESQAGVVYNIPVKVYHAKGATSVTYTVSGNATSGVDYSFSDKGGVLNFPAGTDSLAIPVRVTGQPGTFTGNLNFKVQLTGATDGVTLGGTTAFVMTIKDLDHPLSALFGDYEMKALSATNSGGAAYPTWTMKMSQYEGDPTRIWMSNLTYFSATAYASYTKDCPVWGKVSDDKKTITIPLPQLTTGSLEAFMGPGEQATMFAHEGLGGNYITKDTDVVFKLQDDGRWVTQDNFGIGHPDDLADYPDLFYEYCVNYSSYNANYPTYFKKK